MKILLCLWALMSKDSISFVVSSYLRPSFCFELSIWLSSLCVSGFYTSSFYSILSFSFSFWSSFSSVVFSFVLLYSEASYEIFSDTRMLFSPWSYNSANWSSFGSVIIISLSNSFLKLANFSYTLFSSKLCRWFFFSHS